MTIRVRKPPVDHAAALSAQLTEAGIPHVREWLFHPTRKWRMDIGFPEDRLGVEIQGGIWIGGRHTTGSGVESDTEKLSEAVAMGIRGMQVTPKQVKDGRALGWIKRALGVTDIQVDPYPASLVQ